MSIRTYLDNSFFHSLHEWSEQSKALVTRKFSSYRHSLYPSVELFAEMAAILNTSKRGRLPEKAAFLLHIMNSGHVLDYGGNVLRGELIGPKPTTRFLDCGRSAKLKIFLHEMSESQIRSHIPSFLTNFQHSKQTDCLEWQSMKDNFRKSAEQKFGRVSPKDCSFDEFYANARETMISDLLKIQRKKGRTVLCETKDVLSKPKQYSYTNALIKGLSALTYLNVFENRHVEGSDSIDVQQLVYLVDLDLLVSDDGKMKDVCKLVYGDSLKIISPRDFLN